MTKFAKHFTNGLWRLLSPQTHLFFVKDDFYMKDITVYLSINTVCLHKGDEVKKLKKLCGLMQRHETIMPLQHLTVIYTSTLIVAVSWYISL